MENPFLAFFMFVVILFSYIHITAQWKTSNDLEIYEADFESPANLQEICAVKQPVLFKFQKNPVAVDFFERFQSAKFEKYDNIDIRIKDRKDYDQKDQKQLDQAVDHVPLSFRSARRLMTTDTTAKYFSEKNHLFLEESGLNRLSHSLDAFLKPPLTAYTKYDILLGSPLVSTPLRYRLESHNFIAVARGKIRVKLCPPKYSKIIPTHRDYENYEFWSPLNPNSTTLKDTELLQKLKFLEVDVNSGDILYLPSYWWYSVAFSGDPETTAAGFTYDVAMNVAAQSNHWGLYYLQQNNIKNRPAKTIVMSEDGDLKDKVPIDEVAKEVKLEETSQPVKREIVTNAGIYVTGDLPSNSSVNNIN